MPKEHKPKSPVVAGPAPALPASVEESYRQKCRDIKKRISEIESSNDLLTSRIQRARRAIQRMRLERAFLLEQLEKRTDARVADSEGSPSPPPTPSQKPLRVKRPRKDAPAAAADSPHRHGSESPTRGAAVSGGAASGAGAGAGADTEYPFVNQSFVPADTTAPNVWGNAKTIIKGSVTINPSGNRSYGYRTRGGPKRPPNAYMIFCERERDSVRERESSKEGFDMHKALAQAWRDLKPEGQKPYFDEYERNKASYTQKVNELRDFSSGQQAAAAAKRAVSTASSVAAVADNRGGSPPGGASTNDDEAEDQVMTGSGEWNR